MTAPRKLTSAQTEQGEERCLHDWYQGKCVHCEITPTEYRAALALSQRQVIAEPAANGTAAQQGTVGSLSKSGIENSPPPVDAAAPADALPTMEQLRGFEIVLHNLTSRGPNLPWLEGVFTLARIGRAALDAEPVAWMIELADSQYPVDDLDDPQAVDDLTNSAAVAAPLIAKPEVK